MTVNIADRTAIEKYLTAQAGDNAQVAAWLNVTLAKSLSKRKESAVVLKAPPTDAPEWLLNKWDTCGPFHEFKPDPELDDKVRHIKDWLISAQMHDEPFLKDLDDKGRPKKLVALDLDGAHNAADKYMRRLNQKLFNTVADDADTKTVMTFEDGSRIVQLLTLNALKVEGPKMGHCIGQGAYDDVLLDGSCKFYSLRDAKNEPHATFHVEVKGNVLRQCKGKENQPPIQKYMPMVQQFVSHEKLKPQEGPRYTGLVQSGDGQYHSIYKLPRNFSVGSGLDLRGFTGLTTLPENLSVRGDLNLGSCTGLTALPEKLSVKGNLCLYGCTSLTMTSKKLFVKGYLYLNNCPWLTALPKNLSVGGFLDLQGCTELRSIPRTIKCKRILTDLGTFDTAADAADAFDRKYGRVVQAVKNPVLKH